ncbi:AraC-like DNA-binding protein [Streptomyces sp. MAA16]|nr:AraC-like DNA-binding protein [Streptomyces sp. MAA16]
MALRKGSVMIETVFHTHDLPPGERADAFVEQLSRSHAPVGMAGRPGAGFLAHQRIIELGRVAVVPATMDSFVIHRTPRLIRRSDPESYHLSLITRGTVGLSLAGRDTVYGVGQMRTNDSSRPLEIRLGTGGERIEAVSVDVPRSALPLPAAKVARVIGRPLDGRGGVGALFATFLTGLAANSASYTAADVPRLETVLTDLLAALFAHELDALDALAPETRTHTLVLRIRAFIHQHLGDPGLTPGRVADAHHISVSYLHRIFRERDRPDGGPGTVMGYIRAERLERARRELADPALRGRPVHEIAHRWGFAHPSAFARAFRAAYGVAAREYRMHALDAVSAAGGRGQVLLGPDGLALGGVAGAPAAGELGDQEEAAAVLVEGAGVPHPR